jgi:hypothetical protein
MTPPRPREHMIETAPSSTHTMPVRPAKSKDRRYRNAARCVFLKLGYVAAKAGDASDAISSA